MKEAHDIGAGRLNRRITFERAGPPIDDGYAKRPGAFATYWTCAAEVVFGTGQERRVAAQEAASAPATFRVRWNSQTKTITPLDRIRFMDAVWDITSAVPLGRNKFLEVTATRAAP